MARYTGPKYRLCRREGMNLFENKKFDIEIRNYPPGDHGNKRRVKLSNYGLQMREKQKVKRIYGILERQFRRYYEKASRSKGVTGTMLLQFLERRLDNVIFRLGFATSRPQARQIVGHGLVCVNDKRVNIPSFLVSEGDNISIKCKEKSKKFIEGNITASEERGVPGWLTADAKHLKGKVNKLPSRSDITLPISEQLIIELYSK